MPPRRRRRHRHNYRKLLWIGSGVLIALVMPFVVAAVLIATANPNTVKQQVQEAVRRAIGRELTIDGTLSLSASLTPTLVATDVRLANAPGGSRPDMIRLDELDLQLALRPLLLRRFVVTSAVLLHPDILLETDANGHGNWQLAEPARNAPPPLPTRLGAPAPPQPPVPQIELPRLTLQTLHVRDGTLTWHDARTGLSTIFDIRRISATAATGDTPVSVGAEIIVNQHRIELTAQTGTLSRLQDMAAKTPWGLFANVDVSGAKLTVAGSLTQPLLGRGYSLRLDAAIPDLDALSWLSPIQLPPLHNVTVTARVLDQNTVMPDVSDVVVQSGLTNLDDISPGFTIDSARIEMPRLTEPVVANVSGNFAGTALKLSATIGALAMILPNVAPSARPRDVFPVDITADAGGATFGIRGSIARPTQWSGMDIAVGARVPDLSVLSPLAGTPLPALQTIAFSGHLLDAGTSYWDGLTLKGMVLTLPQGDLSGDITLRFGARPQLTAQLSSTRIDTDRLRAVFAAKGNTGLPGSRRRPTDSSGVDVTAPPPVPQVSSTVISDIPLPLAQLERGDLDVQAAVGELHVGGNVFRDVAGHLVLSDGKLTLDPLHGELPAGQAGLTLTLDGHQQNPPMALALHVSGLDAQPLLAALSVPAPVSGKLDLNADLHGAGRSLHAIAASLDGRLGIGLSDGDVNGTVLAAGLTNLWQTLRTGGNPADAVDPGWAKVACIAVRADLSGGVATLGTAVMDSARALINASGRINLADETLALQLRPMMRFNGPLGVVVPMTVSGSFRDPRVAVETPPAQAAAGHAAPPAKPLPATTLGEHGGDVCGPALVAVRGPVVVPPAAPAASQTPAASSAATPAAAPAAGLPHGAVAPR